MSLTWRVSNRDADWSCRNQDGSLSRASRSVHRSSFGRSLLHSSRPSREASLAQRGGERSRGRNVFLSSKGGRLPRSRKSKSPLPRPLPLPLPNPPRGKGGVANGDEVSGTPGPAGNGPSRESRRALVASSSRGEGASLNGRGGVRARGGEGGLGRRSYSRSRKGRSLPALSGGAFRRSGPSL